MADDQPGELLFPTHKVLHGVGAVSLSMLSGVSVLGANGNLSTRKSLGTFLLFSESATSGYPRDIDMLIGDPERGKRPVTWIYSRSNTN
jgi:hypothetical protein